MTDTMTKTCECGELVEVEAVDMSLPYAGLLSKIGVLCSECAENARQAEEARIAENDRQDRMWRTSTFRRNSQIPAALQGHVWSDLGDLDPALLRALKAWAAGEIKGLLLTGPVGAGKTFSAAVAAWAMLERRSLMWTSSPLLFARLGSGMGSDPHHQALEILTGRQALVLDDLDKARPTEYGAEQIFLAVDQRVSNNVPLLATTNLSVAEIARRMPEPFGEATASRLAGYCEIHNVPGRDRRVES